MSSRRRHIVGILLFLTAVFAVTTIWLQWKYRHPPLPKLRVLSEFSLTERTGAPVRLADLKGKVWLADFVYTTCPGPCPMLSTRFGELQKTALRLPEVRLVSISTDPVKDTPEVLRQYASHYAAGDGWLFLTGDKNAVYDLIQRGFALAVAEQDDVKNPVVHSTRIALVDKAGVVRKYYNGEEGGASDEEILADLRRLGSE